MSELVGCIYGASSVGKTSSIASLARYLWKTQKLQTRVLSASTGGVKPLSQLMELGIVEVLFLDQWAHPFMVLEQVAKGYWPENVASPDSKLLPGVKEWKPCPLCGGDSGAQRHTTVLKCASCGKPLPAGTTLVLKRELTHLKTVGALCFESLTEIGDSLLASMADRSAKGEQVGSQDTVKFSDGLGEDGKPFMLGNNNMAHYGIAQDTLMKAVKLSKDVPVPCIWWTSLEQKTDDNGQRVYLPLLPGKKAAAKCLAWFTDVIHMDFLGSGKEKDKDGLIPMTRKFFLSPHFAADDPVTPYRAKVSVHPEGQMPSVLDPDLGLFMEELQKAKDRAMAKLKASL